MFVRQRETQLLPRRQVGPLQKGGSYSAIDCPVFCAMCFLAFITSQEHAVSLASEKQFSIG